MVERATPRMGPLALLQKVRLLGLHRARRQWQTHQSELQQYVPLERN
ncbi:hypothetical protein MAR_025766 [Mya arenaria]|uniref:Uncharacterized protein n=1 Tax=Mya arenaria TaxID=6604 RepID=A0ABY7ES86_MYAAR|nr:hypothetical protein MAR_025766 [Mya arenaria]